MKSGIDLRVPVGTPAFLSLASGVTTAAYTQLIAATKLSCSGIEVVNTSAVPLQLAIGGVGSEVATPYIIPPSTCPNLIPIEIVGGVRLSVKALGAAPTSGYLTTSFFA